MEILKAAQIAEALAVTTYTNIINTAPFFKNLESDDQGYLKAAVQEEMSHYLLEESLTKQPTPFTMFYYPPKMFTDAQTTLNILVTLEDAFIAAYLVGVREFSTRTCGSRPRASWASSPTTAPSHASSARVAWRRRPGRADHRDPKDGLESVDPPNNNGYERTLLLEEHRAGRRSAAAVRRKRRPPKKRASTRPRSTSSNRSPPRSPAPWANSTR